MSVMKIILVPILAIILFVAVTAGLPMAAGSQIITNKEELKLILGKRSVFDSVSAALKSTAELSNQSSDSQGGGDQLALNKVIDHYLTVDTYNRAVNAIIDGTYDWLDGKIDKPTFTVPLTDNKAEFQA